MHEASPMVTTQHLALTLGSLTHCLNELAEQRRSVTALTQTVQDLASELHLLRLEQTAIKRAQQQQQALSAPAAGLAAGTSSALSSVSLSAAGSFSPLRWPDSGRSSSDLPMFTFDSSVTPLHSLDRGEISDLFAAKLEQSRADSPLASAAAAVSNSAASASSAAASSGGASSSTPTDSKSPHFAAPAPEPSPPASSATTSSASASDAKAGDAKAKAAAASDEPREPREPSWDDEVTEIVEDSKTGKRAIRQLGSAGVIPKTSLSTGSTRRVLSSTASTSPPPLGAAASSSSSGHHRSSSADGSQDKRLPLSANSSRRSSLSPDRGGARFGPQDVRSQDVRSLHADSGSSAGSRSDLSRAWRDGGGFGEKDAEWRSFGASS